MDRSAVRERIKRAVRDGRITSADAEIRMRNVDSAQSEAELDLIVRDLDQLESTIAPAPVPSAQLSVSPEPGGSSRVWVPALVVVIVLVVLGAGAGALLVFRSAGEPQVVSGLSDPVPLTAEVSPTEQSSEPYTGARTPAPANAAYSLSAAGLRTFIATYRHRFGTTRTVSATFYGDYVVVQVPVSGKARHTGWVYRQAGGFTDFGGTSANVPGSATVDLAKLDLAALFKNVSLAKRVLKVENANQTYVNIDYRPDFDPAPNVNIYLSNEFNESGYLATRLNGRVERSYPFGGQ